MVRDQGLAGTPAQVVETLHAYAAIGCSRFYLQLLDMSDHDHVRLITSDVMPYV